jgi:hypothetical protein
VGSAVAPITECLLRVDHDRQRLVVHDHPLRRVHRLGAGLGDDCNDGVTDEAHDSVGQRGPAERGVEHDEALHRGEPERVLRVHTDDPGHALGLARVDRSDRGVRHRRAHEHDVGAAVGLEVVEVLRFAREDARVFDTPDGVIEDGARSGHGAGLYVVTPCDAAESAS